MKLTVFGATGGTGKHLVNQALDAGHEVTAVVRDPARLPRRHDALTVLTAEVTDPESLRPALEGRDAVASALAAGGPTGDLAATSMRAILHAMSATGVRRLAVVSAVPVGPPPPGEALFVRLVMMPLLRRILRTVYADLAAMEAEIQRSEAEWTILRPPRLLDKPFTGRYRQQLGGAVPGGRSIPRADLAHAVLTMLDDKELVGQIVGVAS